MRWLTILLCLMFWACIQEESSDNYTKTLLEARQATVLANAEAQRMELQSYISALRGIARESPYFPVAKDSVVYATAVAIYKDMRTTGLPASFYMGLVRVENPYLDPYIVNWYGAVGLTQVVERFWLGEFPECGDDLRTSIDTQICYGARVYLHYLSVYGDTTAALYAYNGCSIRLQLVGASCVKYPALVLDHARKFQETMDD